ncbi:MAG: Uma2 family endonuclease [Planctomycetota bacterium]|nr:Uma2 family endonuclease [Planctomycetota bacterium]
MSLWTSTTDTFNDRLAVPTVSIWRLTVEQYRQMLRKGILTEDDPVELLDGWLVTKMPKNPPHRLATGLVREALEQALPQGWYVDSQEPITLLSSESEPDIIVVRGNRRDYPNRHPGPSDLGLVVEVAEASLERDQTLKRVLYAQAAIPVYWILNLIDRGLDVYSDPSGPAEHPDYRSCHAYAATDVVPFLLDTDEIARINVQHLLP